MEDELDVEEREKAMEDRLKDWIKRCFSGKIDEFTFFNLVALNQYEKDLLHYTRKPDPYIGLIINYIEKEHLTPKKKQQIKEELKKVERIFNDLESGIDEKNDITDKAMEKIEKIFEKILELVNGKSN